MIRRKISLTLSILNWFSFLLMLYTSLPFEIYPLFPHLSSIIQYIESFLKLNLLIKLVTNNENTQQQHKKSIFFFSKIIFNYYISIRLHLYITVKSRLYELPLIWIWVYISQIQCSVEASDLLSFCVNLKLKIRLFYLFNWINYNFEISISKF